MTKDTEFIDKYKDNSVKIKRICKDFTDWMEEHQYLEDFYAEDKVSNCCSAKVINGICQDCGEHCIEVETE